MGNRSSRWMWPTPSAISSQSIPTASWCAPREPLGSASGTDCGKLFLQHGVDQGVELAAINHFDKGLAVTLVADHVERGRVLDVDGLSQFLVGIDEGGELAGGIDYEGQVHFVVRCKLLGKLAQILGRDLELVGEDVIAEFVAQRLGVRVEIARENGSIVGPGM